MPDKQLANLFLEQSNDLIWIIDSNFCLKYANQAYQNVMKQVTGEGKKIDEPIFVEGFGAGYIDKWKAYYERGLKGEPFEIEEHFYNSQTNQVEYSQISFKPITNENQVVVNVACQSRDITSFKKSNAEAEIIMDASLDVICQIDEYGIFTKVSAACKDLWGYEKHELIGKAYIDFVIEEDKAKTNEAAAEILLGKTVTTFENRYKRKDGGIASNLWSVRYDTNTKNLFGIARDAREKIQKEELLVESENRFKALVQEGADMISIIDAAGKYIYTSPTTTAILGITPEEFDGNSVFDFIHPDDIERSAGYLQRINTENKVIVEPFRLRDGNNEWRWIETVLTNMLDNPAVRGIVANSRDITAKKKETQHLKLLESVITNTNDAVLITEAEPFDEPGPRILYVNEAFTRMTGYAAEEVIGKTPRILQGPNSDKAELARLSKAIRNWEPCEISTINYKKNGEEFWINFSVSPVADETGWYTHWIAIERDVTEKKKLELSNDLNSKISSIFNIEPDLSSALSKLCKEVATIGQFSFCEIWLTDIQENLLELKALNKNDDAANIFYEKAKLNTVFEKGQGVPGKIWENAQPIIWEYKGKNQELLFRSAAAKKAGINTIVGFPLMYHDKFIGALQFGTQSTSKNIEWIITALEELGEFIGAEIARKKTEIELTKIFEFAPDIIVTTGFDGKLKKVNPYTCKLLGYSENELISKPFSAHIHPDDLEKSIMQLSNLSSGNPLYNWVNRQITKNGDIITISWNVSPSLEDGLIFCIGKDITEEVKIGNLLKESNQLARIGSWEVDLINNSIYWSDITHAIHETPENFKPQLSEAINFYREDFRELATKAVNACIETETPFDFEAILVTSKKNEVWVRAMGKAEVVNGKCVRLFGSFQDIHERKEAEVRLQSLSNNIPGVVFQYVIYPDGTDRLLYVSDGAELIWGFSADEAMQNNQQIWKQLEKGGDLEAHKKSIQISIETKSLWKNKYRYVMPNNEIKTHLGYGTPTFLTDGKIVFNSVILDITEEAKNEALLKQTSNIARIGSWEVDLINSSMFWSDITNEIHETPKNYKPQLSEAINFYREDFRELATKAVNACFETGDPFDFEAILVTNKNNEVWVRAMGKAELVDGKCARIFGSFQDINERKIAEHQKNSLLTTLEKSLNEIYVFDAETLKFTYVNQGALINIGYSEKEIKTLTPLDLKPEFTATTFNQLTHPLVTKEKEKIVFFTNHKRKNGSLYPVEIHLQLVEEGNNKRFLAVILDITDLKEAEQLLASASKLARVGSWELVLQDNEEFKMFWSSMTKNILEIDESFDPTLADGISVYKEPSRTFISAAVNNAIEKGEAFDLELEVLTGKGNDIWIRCIGDAQFENGKVTRIYGSFQDINSRKLAELNQLKLIEEKSKILESIGDAFFAVDNEWTVTYWNNVAEKSFQKNRNEIVGKNLWEVYHDAIESDFYTNYHNAMETMETQSFEAFYETFNQWLEVTAYPSKDGLSVYFKDITQRKKANEEIAKSEEKRRLIMNGALDAIITIDTNETISFWNPQAEVIFGWKAEEVIGKPLSEMIIPEHFRKYHVEGLKNYLKTGEGKALNVLLELSAIRRNTEEFPIELTVIPIKQGGEEFFCAFIRDITQRKKAEADRIMAEKSYQELFDKSNDAIYIHDIDTGQLIDVNYRATELTGFDKVDILEKAPSILFTDNPEYTMEKALNYVQKAAQGKPQVFEWLSRKKDGTSGWFEMTLKRTNIAGVDKILAFQRDIAERKNAEIELLAINQKLNIQTKELKRSNEELEQFAFIASHDLQEPLRMVSSFMDQLKRKYADRLDEKGLQYIYFATDGAKRMKQIILDLLLYSRANRPTEQNELINLNKIVSEYTQLRRKVIGEKNATITFDGLPSIETYRAPITQIFHCLIDNALKYVDENKQPHIEISAIEKENVWQFAVKDNGIGIDPIFFDKIFIIFQRLQNRKEQDGTGIGLAIAKRSIEFLGGEIWVESEIDKGSTFYFTILKTKQFI